ncbi:MAG: GNAT family N-acetyltransferase [Rhodospirillales bacterium]
MEFRDAIRNDLDAIVALLADDALGSSRERAETPLPACYEEAFQAVQDDPNSRLIVADDDGNVVGCLQITMIPNISHQGGWRAQIEGVRIAASTRGSGLGRRMFEHAIGLARAKGCRMVQLTTDRKRPEALSFYESLGFSHSHAGMKLSL